MLSPGGRIGRYEIVAPLRSGGMASLYLGRRVGPGGFSRPVAIKVLHEHLASRREFVQMFLDEARLSARFSHPNLVQVDELGQDGDRHFLAMEYLLGPSLSVLQKALVGARVRLAPSLACALAMRVADGLHAAHETRDSAGRLLDVVHRDVSPQNVLLSAVGHVKLIDFGIARTREPREQTETGVLKGKPRYMAPEQAWGRPVDRRTDVYALGVVLWEMLTHRRPFAGASPAELIDKVRTTKLAPPTRVVPGLPPDLDHVILTALAVDPEERFATARAFRRALGTACPEALHVEPDDLAALVESAVGDAVREERRLFEAGRVANPTAVERSLTAHAALVGPPPEIEDASEVTPSDAPEAELEAPPIAAADARPHDAGSRLVGRHDETAALRALAREPGVVLITGPAGVGKSALARSLVAIERLRARSALRVSLADARDPASPLVAALGVPSAGAGSAQALAFALAAHDSMLVVLDDIEHLAEEVARLLAELTVRAPGATFLVVSRVALADGVPRSLEVRPLGHDDSVALFAERARPFVGSAALEAGADAVDRIVSATDGLPLAIEVAASRLGDLTLEELAARVSPTGASWGGEASPVSLALDRWLDVLGAEELATLGALSVFCAPFEIDEAEIVVRAAGAAALPAARVVSLRDKSLLLESASGGLSLLKVVRARAMQVAQPGSLARAARAHASLVAGRARDQVALDDVRAALRCAIDQELPLDVTASLAGLLGHASQELELGEPDLALLDAALARAETPAEVVPLAEARAQALARWGTPPVARTAWLALRAAAEHAGDRAAAARADVGIGVQQYEAFRMTEAQEILERACAELRALGEHAAWLAAVTRLGAAHGSAGNVARAGRLLELSLTEAIRLGDEPAIAQIEANLASHAMAQGFTELAWARFDVARHKAQAAGRRRLAMLCQGYSGLARLMHRGDDGPGLARTEQARDALEAAAREARVVGYRRAAGYFSCLQAVALGDLGQHELAARVLASSMALLVGGVIYDAQGEVMSGLVVLGAGHGALARGERSIARESLLEATRRAEVARAVRLTTGEGRGPLAVEVSDDLRWLLSMLDARLDQFRAALEPSVARGPRDDGSSEVAAARPTLVVSRSGARFRIDGRLDVSLEQRPLLARLLLSLAERSRVGAWASSDELVRSAWPDEALAPRAGKMRLLLGLAELGELGLGELVERSAEGHRLGARIVIERD